MFQGNCYCPHYIKVKVQSGWETGSGSYNRDELGSGFEPALIPPHRAAPEVQNSRDALSVADDRSPPVSVAGPHGQILSTGLSGRCWLESPGAVPLPPEAGYCGHTHPRAAPSGQLDNRPAASMSSLIVSASSGSRGPSSGRGPSTAPVNLQPLFPASRGLPNPREAQLYPQVSAQFPTLSGRC